jgi:glycosyltransferase EpsE
LPVVSVIVPVYNEETRLQNALLSIVNQTFKDIELIICDDASTDSTPAAISRFVHEYSKRFVRITCLRNEQNLGYAKNVNVGLRQATGDLVAFQDADDVSLPDKLEKQVRRFELNSDPKLGIVGCGFRYSDTSAGLSLDMAVPENHHDLIIKLPKAVPIPFAGSLFRREVFDRVGALREDIAGTQDYEFFYRAVLSGYTMAACPETLIIYNLSSDNLSRKTKPIRKRLLVALYSYKAVRDLRLPPYLYLYSILWAGYAFVPERIKRIVRVVLLPRYSSGQAK